MKLGLLTIVVATSFATGTVEPTPDEISGVYLCEGENGDGHTYQAVVNIIEYGDAYRMHWTFPSGEPGAFGMAVRDGDSLAVMFVSGTAGVAVYRRQENGQLVGHWTLTNADGAVYLEKLTKIPGVTPMEPREPAEQEAPRRRTRAAVKVKAA